MKTIADVLFQLDEIVNECKRIQSRIGYFAILYRQVTRRIRDGILAREFEDNERMEQLDIHFAHRFIEAYELYKRGEKPTESWNTAFEASEKSNHLVLQHLFLGINAHINLDLGIAVVETVAENPIEVIHADFNTINRILSELVNGVKANISKVSPIFGTLIPLAKGKDELLLNFSIQIARDGAWQYAVDHYSCEDAIQSIQERDSRITKIAQRLLNPGKFLRFMVKMVGFAEWKSVSRTMDQLDVIVKEA